MKLIDLLVQELPRHGDWPKGACFIACDSDGAVDSYRNEPEKDDTGLNWRDSEGLGYFTHLFSSRAIDWECAIITRGQYEAALAASKQVEWNGEGLPPVGCECEFFNEDYECRESVPKNGTIVKVVAHQKSKSGIDCAVFTWHGERCAVHAEVCNEYLFRPIRTEAERKRENAIKNMMDCSAVMVEATAGLIYDAIAAGEIPGVKLEG